MMIASSPGLRSAHTPIYALWRGHISTSNWTFQGTNSTDIVPVDATQWLMICIAYCTLAPTNTLVAYCKESTWARSYTRPPLNQPADTVLLVPAITNQLRLAINSCLDFFDGVQEAWFFCFLKSLSQSAFSFWHLYWGMYILIGFVRGSGHSVNATCHLFNTLSGQTCLVVGCGAQQLQYHRYRVVSERARARS